MNKLKSDFVSSYKMPLDLYMGQYSSFYDFYFKPNILFRKASRWNWVFYSLLQKKKKFKQFYLMEPFLTRQERPYKHVNQRKNFVSGFMHVFFKSKSNNIKHIPYARYLFDKFRKNISLYFYGASSDYILPIQNTLPLKRYVKFMERRRQRQYQRIPNRLKQSVFRLYLRNLRLRRKRFKLKLHSQAAFKPVQYRGIDSYSLNKILIKSNINYSNDFRRFEINMEKWRVFHNGQNKDQYSAVNLKDHIVLFRSVDLQKNSYNDNFRTYFKRDKNYTLTEREDATLDSSFFSYYNYFYLTSWYGALWSHYNHKMELDFFTVDVTPDVTDRFKHAYAYDETFPLGYSLNEVFVFLNETLKLRNMYSILNLSFNETLKILYPRLSGSLNYYWFVGQMFEKMKHLDWFIYMFMIIFILNIIILC